VVLRHDCYNPSVLARGVQFLLFLTAFSLAACSNQIASVASSTSSGPIVPFYTPTPSGTVAAEIEGAAPTSTPYIYTVAPNDTFFSIAARLNIDLNELLAANPSVDPRVLIPGTLLVVPVTGQTSAATSLPTLTPVAAGVSPSVCYSTASAELWCFLLVANDEQQTMENLIGEIQLIGKAGDVMATTQAVPPIDILETGERMPLVAYFQSPPEGWVGSQGRLLTAFELSKNGEDYLMASASNVNLQIDDSGLSAHVQGNVQLQENQSAKIIWVVGVAYAANGDVVGYRRWESAGDLDFDFWVYSLGPKINNVEVLVEALP
jgi:LysM repeat protein